MKHISWNDRSEALAALHGLPSVEKLDRLFEELDGLAIRDQGGLSGPAATDQRKRVTKAARTIKLQANIMIKSAETLHSALRDFASAVEVDQSNGRHAWSASMLHEVFEVGPIAPAALNLPPALGVLGAMALSEHQWLNDLEFVRDLAGLPVRKRISPGPVGGPVLVRAVLACRSFWKRLGRAWTRKDLEEAIFRDKQKGARPEDLRGPAVRFLVDALTAADIRYSLTNLNSAWVDAEASLSGRAVTGRDKVALSRK